MASGKAVPCERGRDCSFKCAKGNGEHCSWQVQGHGQMTLVASSRSLNQTQHLVTAELWTRRRELPPGCVLLSVILQS